MESRVKTPPPSFYGLKTEEQVAHHLRHTDFEYNPMKTAKAVWFDSPYNEVESLPGHVHDAMDRTPQDAVTGIAIISQSIKANGDVESARCPMLVPIPKDTKLLSHPSTFREGLWIVVAGSGKEPFLHVYENGFEITADGISTYGKGLRKVSFAITTMDNDADGEQLLAWQQERRNKHR